MTLVERTPYYPSSKSVSSPVEILASKVSAPAGIRPIGVAAFVAIAKLVPWQTEIPAATSHAAQ